MAEPVLKPIPSGVILRIKRRLDNPAALLKQVGAVILSDAQLSFRQQRLGDRVWPHRYPNQSGPFVNVAGAVSDLRRTANIKARRFDRRPVLKDTGVLSRSLANRAKAIALRGKYVVEVGTTVEHARIHQWGGVSKQAVNQSVRDNLAKVMKRSKRNKAKKEALKRLGFLFRAKSLTTKVAQRPFIGITDTAAKKIKILVEEKLNPGRDQAGGMVS